MANQLLAARGSGQVDETWATNFIRGKPDLKPRLTRQRDGQRVLSSNPEVISQPLV